MKAREGLQPPFEQLVACEQRRSATGFRRAGFAPVEHWVSWTWDANQNAPMTDPRAHDAAELEARALARDVAALHREHGVAWREIGLLFRSTGDLEIYLSALRDASIPYVVERDRSYYRRREIIEASALLRCVLDPHDHLALITVLRSAVVGIPDAALMPLWCKGFQALLAELPDAEASSAASAVIAEVAASLPADIPGLERIGGWERNLLAVIEALALLRSCFEAEPADRFVERLRTLLLLEATESARYLGAYRLANLDRFFRDVTSALDESGGDLSALLAKLRAAVSEAQEQEEGRPKDAADSAVQVMTVHKAKGLDFEHVYLMQLHKGHRQGRETTTAAAERDGDWEYALFGAATPGYLQAAIEAAEVEAAERVRTLYVAMTRAKDRVVLAAIHPTRCPALVSAKTHADLLSHRSPPVPDLPRLMSELQTREGGAHVDDGEARWLFPALRALRGEGQAATGPADDRSEASGPSVEEIRASAEGLSVRRRDAAHRAARPFHAAASDEAHEADAEEALLRGYGGEDESASRTHGGPIDESDQRIALAVGSAVHGALEIFDPARDRDAEIERCRCEIEASAPETAPRDWRQRDCAGAAPPPPAGARGAGPGGVRERCDRSPLPGSPRWRHRDCGLQDRPSRKPGRDPRAGALLRGPGSQLRARGSGSPGAGRRSPLRALVPASRPHRAGPSRGVAGRSLRSCAFQVRKTQERKERPRRRLNSCSRSVDI
jgi:ATP-dependent exoDNAse (exonuclease V) beta subunit